MTICILKIPGHINYVLGISLPRFLCVSGTSSCEAGTSLPEIWAPWHSQALDIADFVGNTADSSSSCGSLLHSAILHSQADSLPSRVILHE